MEHPCPRCNSQVEDSSPFCPNCGASQVRFSRGEHSKEPVIIAAMSGEEGPGPARHVIGTPGSLGRTYSHSSASANTHSQAALRSALIAGIVAVLLSSLPVRPAFVVALPIAGFSSVLFYRRWNPGARLTRRGGFRLGALAGLFGFATLILLGAAETLAFHLEDRQREAIVEIVRQTQARTADPQARQMLDYFTTPQGMVVMMSFGFVFTGIAFILLSGLGAAVAAVLLRRKPPPE